MGNFIVDMYKYFDKNGDVSAIAYDYHIGDFLITKPTEEVPENVENGAIDTNGDSLNGNDAADAKSENEELTPNDKENSNSNTDSGKFLIPSDVQSAEASAEDSDANKDGAPDGPSKPKSSRRRGSGLQFLEQWCFWDRNRKYSQRRRNQQNDRSEVDNTIKGALRKILPKYFE